jgi:tetratricopeptide (TPR) repeat protein
MVLTIDLDEHDDPLDEFDLALEAGRLDTACEIADRLARDPDEESWVVTGMLEDIGLALAREGRHDESIATFERAIELGWDVVPDGRCEIARVLLLAGRRAEADALWSQLRDADPGGVWTLNAGGLAYNEVERDEEAITWLAEGLRVAIDAEDPERVVDQMSHARRNSLERLGRGRDALEREVEAFKVLAAQRDEKRAQELRRARRSAGLPVAQRTITATWLTEDDDRTARELWPDWTAGALDDAPYAERRALLEHVLRARRSDGDGPIVVVTIDLERYAAWCEEESFEPADRASRGTFVNAQRDAGAGRAWPPGRNEPCWCSSTVKYKRCCGALMTPAAAEPAG